MILIDSVYVNTGGSLILLKYLVSTLEKMEIDVFYLFDIRVQEVFNFIDKKNCKFIKNSNFERFKFYKDMRFSNLKKVLCFGNAPPVIRLDIPVYVYFHNQTLIKTHQDMNFKNYILTLCKQGFVHFYKKNVDIWFVQNNYMRENLALKYFNGFDNHIINMPFYPEILYPDNIKRIPNTFLYVSTTYPHKNHNRLIEAFCASYDDISKGELILTVPFSDKELCSLIDEKKSIGYPITNLGFIDRDKLIIKYKECEYLIFPSLAETFGLGLVEAIDGGCKVIAADLPYTYEVCEPSFTFDPLSTTDIQKSITFAIENQLAHSTKHIQNDINKLISYLK